MNLLSPLLQIARPSVRSSGKPTLIRTLVALLLSAVAADGEPLLSVDITTLPGEDYATATAIAKDAGATATSLSLLWDEAEGPGGVYAPDPDWPAIANAYYPSEGLGITLTLSIIDTVADRRPADLRGLDWDDPALTARFGSYLTRVLSDLEDTDIIALSVGNEIDGFLADDDAVAAFAGLVAAARGEVARIRPGLPVGAKIAFAALASDPARWQPVMDASDAVMTTYYPLNPDMSVRPVADIPGDLDRLVGLARGKPVMILEAGYPSTGCGAPDDGQSAFVQSLVAEWQARADAIPLLSLTWLTDLSEAEVAALTAYYGLNGDCFRRYLASLGLRDAEGVPKPALLWLTGTR